VFWKSTFSRNTEKTSLNNKVYLRTNYKNLNVSAGVENMDVFDHANRLPKLAGLRTSYIHDVNADTRVYGGLNLGFGLSPLRLGQINLLAGFNYLRKHRAVLVAGGKFCEMQVKGDSSKNEKESTQYLLCKTVGLTVSSEVNDKLKVGAELNVSQGCEEEKKCEGSKADAKECGKNVLKNCDYKLAAVAEYEVDKNTNLKLKVTSENDLVLSYLHSYGVCNFGFVSKVINLK